MCREDQKRQFFLLVCSAESDLMGNADESASSCGVLEPPVTAVHVFADSGRPTSEARLGPLEVATERHSCAAVTVCVGDRCIYVHFLLIPGGRAALWSRMSTFEGQMHGYPPPPCPLCSRGPFAPDL